MSVSTLDDIEDVPDIAPGEVVHNENGDLSFRIISQIGAGRCCVVYKAVAVRDGSLVALKCFHAGDNYAGAIQRERFILETLTDPNHNIVTCHGTLEYRDHTFFVLELLQDNVRQIIFKNDRRGLSPWLVVKFAKDLLVSLNTLHQLGIVHGDLKPHNILWSGDDKVFKTIDFGLSYNVDEPDLHQTQSIGYRAPETEDWNNFKESQKSKKRRRLKGSFQIINDTNSKNANNSKGPTFGSFVENTCDIMATNDDIIKATEEHPLQHNDSQDSSGYFSHDNSEQSQISFKDDSDLILESDSFDKDFLCNTEAFDKKNVTGDYADKLESRDMQDLRKTQRKCDFSTFFLTPSRPGPAADMWSYGCLLAEVLTGRKLFQVGDKMASVLRPAQLLEMKLGDTETLWTEAGHDELFKAVKDLIVRCIIEDPTVRITAALAAKHPVFSYSLSPSLQDKKLVPTTTLQFVVQDQKTDLQPELLLETVMSECQRYGSVAHCDYDQDGNPLVHFHEVGQAIFTRNCLYSKVTNDIEDEDLFSQHEQTTDIILLKDFKFKVLFNL